MTHHLPIITVATTIFIFITAITLMPSPATAVSFNFTTFSPNTMSDIFFQGDSFASNGALQLTKNAVGESLRSSAGRVTSRQLIPLWDSSTGEVTNFTTHFTFTMKAVKLSTGETFFLSPANFQISANSTGGYHTLFTPKTSLNSDKSHQIVAVEFDNIRYSWDPSDDHVGIDVNSIRSGAVPHWEERFNLMLIVVLVQIEGWSSSTAKKWENLSNNSFPIDC